MQHIDRLQTHSLPTLAKEKLLSNCHTLHPTSPAAPSSHCRSLQIPSQAHPACLGGRRASVLCGAIGVPRFRHTRPAFIANMQITNTTNMQTNDVWNDTWKSEECI